VINSIPPGADVRIDGKPAGKTPLQLPRTGGQYDLALSHPDYADVLETLRITNTDSVISRTYRLERKPAILTFSVSPAGGVLLVNGKQIAPSDRVTVSAKTRNRISYRKPGYLPATRQLTLAPNETKRVSIALRADVGAVTIRSRPEASVIVDGKPQGKTPITLKLTAIPHEILLKKEGYRTVKKRVTPTSKQPIVINARLISQTAARLAEAPRSYKNSLGVELKLFEPTGFVMGAPRSQKGQRANEFVRQIKLTRPFYVGRHEITNGQYASFNKKNAAPRDPKKPATSIKWIEAALYCNWLSAKEGLAPFYVIKNGRLVGSFNKANGYRLVTEAEWEWLARKANRSKQTVFPWGDKTVVPPMAGNIADETAKGLARFYVPNYTDGHAEVAPVGSFKAEKSGLFDLTGNVSEWVHNYYSLMPPEPGKIEIDPLGPNYGEGHVIKGSNWRSGTRTELRAAYRDGLFQGRDDVGFRIARYL
jgi:formylglycine-generating enzyme required for sulfatase activity